MFNVVGNSSKGLFGATLGFFFGFAAVSLFGVTASFFKEAMQLSPMLVGLLVAVPALSGSLLRIPFAAWVDTTGGRKPFLVLMSLAVTGMLGLFLMVHFFYSDQMNIKLYPLLLFLGMLSGCGIATFSVGISQVSYWFPQKKQGTALAIYAGVGNLAPGIFSILLPVILGMVGLSGAYFIWLIFLIGGTILYGKFGLNAWFFQLVQQGCKVEEAQQIAKKQYGQEIFPKGSLLESLMVSAKRWKMWILVAVYFTTFGGFIALTAWLPTYWQSYFHLSGVKAGALTALFAISASLIRIVGGKISDKYQGEVTAMGALIILLVGSLLMAQSQAVFLSIGASLLIAIGMGIAQAAVFKLVPQEVPEAVGGASGWVGGLGAFGGFVFPLVFGAVVVKQGFMGYAQGFYVLVVFSFISLLLTALLKRR